MLSFENRDYGGEGASEYCCPLKMQTVEWSTYVYQMKWNGEVFLWRLGFFFLELESPNTHQ